jgi:hypothetical protein
MKEAWLRDFEHQISIKGYSFLVNAFGDGVYVNFLFRITFLKGRGERFHF